MGGAAAGPNGARGGAMTVAAQVVKIIIQFLSVAILSRLLSPSDFGLIALATVFIGVATLLRDFGISTIGLQARSLSNQQASNLFYANLVLGVVGGVVLVAIAPWLATAFGEPRLAALLPVLAVALPIGGASAQYQVQLARSHKFGALALADFVAPLAGLCIAVGGALAGWGFWALALQIVATAAVLLLIQMGAARWRPLPPRSGHGTRVLLGLGANYGAAHLLSFAASNADTLFIAARFTVAELGYYNRAFQLLSLPVQAMLAPLTNVVIPTINRARESGSTIDRSLLRVQFAVGAAAVWVFMCAAVSAHQVIPIFLGPAWGPTATLFQILAIGGTVEVFSFVGYWGFMLYEKSRQLLYYDIVSKGLTIALLLWGSTISVEAVAAAYSLGLLINWPLNLIWLAKCAGQESMKFFLRGLRILAAALAGFLAGSWLLLAIGGFPAVAQILLTVVAASLVFGVVILLSPRGVSDAKDALGMFRTAFARQVS